MTLLLLLVSEAVVLAAAAMAVKTQLALFRGFDLIVATAVVAAAEISITTVALFPGNHGAALVAGGCAAIVVSVILITSWNFLLTGLLKDHSSPGTFLFVFSLGASTVASGLVGMLRGPGVRQMEPANFLTQSFASLSLGSPLIGVLLGIPLLTLLLWLMRQPRWLAIDLLAQDREFAVELGVKPHQAAIAGGVLTGLAAAFVGWYMAHSSGSTPALGLQLFLLGAGGALLLPGSHLSSAVHGGLLLGGVHVLLQLRIAPTLSMALLFVGILVLVVWRGTSRNAQEVR